jgi:hypothetical protein
MLQTGKTRLDTLPQIAHLSIRKTFPDGSRSANHLGRFIAEMPHRKGRAGISYLPNFLGGFFTCSTEQFINVMTALSTLCLSSRFVGFLEVSTAGSRCKPATASA